MTTNTQINEVLLAAILDRLIPAVDDLPAAGQMGLTPEIVRLAGQQARFNSEFTAAMGSIADGNPEFEN